MASKWVLDSEVVPAVILGARNANHVEDHKLLFSFNLDDADRKAIRDVQTLERNPKKTATSMRGEGVGDLGVKSQVDR